MAKIANPNICESIKNSYALSWKDSIDDYTAYDSIDNKPITRDDRIILEVFGYIVVFDKMQDKWTGKLADKYDTAKIVADMIETDETMILQGIWEHIYGNNGDHREENFMIKIFK